MSASRLRPKVRVIAKQVALFCLAAAMLCSTVASALAQAPSFGFSNQYLRYVPAGEASLYPLKQGLSDEESDSVNPTDWYGQPVCMKMATGFQVQLVDHETENNQWRVMSARLYDGVTGQTLWQVTKASSYMAENSMWPPTPIALPNSVNYLKFDIIWMASTGLDLGDTVELLASNEIFVVWDSPKALMSTAWVNVLRWTCQTARETTTEQSYKVALTDGLHADFMYDWSDPGYTDRTGTDAETFNPKSFLLGGVGQCNDFADFLMVAMESLGSSSPVATRTYSLAVSTVDDPYGWAFQTNEFVPAGGSTPTIAGFSYHQFVVTSSNVWDGAIAYYDSTPAVWVCPHGVSTSSYEVILVDVYGKDIDHSGEIDEDERYSPPLDPPWNPTNVTVTLTAG